jgi:hypothetical protein
VALQRFETIFVKNKESKETKGKKNQTQLGASSMHKILAMLLRCELPSSEGEEGEMNREK